MYYRNRLETFKVIDEQTCLKSFLSMIALTHVAAIYEYIESHKVPKQIISKTVRVHLQMNLFIGPRLGHILRQILKT